MERMKIGFIGTQGTGKTTQCYDICACLKKMGHNARVLNEVARKCPFPINEGATRESQLWIFSNTISNELECNAPILVCDRTLLDAYAYSLRSDEKFFSNLKPFVKEYMKSYDIIFYLSPKKTYLLEDGERSTNVEFQAEMKERIENVIEDLDIEVVESEKPLYDVLKLLEKR